MRATVFRYLINYTYICKNKLFSLIFQRRYPSVRPKVVNVTRPKVDQCAAPTVKHIQHVVILYGPNAADIRSASNIEALVKVYIYTIIRNY